MNEEEILDRLELLQRALALRNVCLLLLIMFAVLTTWTVATTTEVPAELYRAFRYMVPGGMALTGAGGVWFNKIATRFQANRETERDIDFMKYAREAELFVVFGLHRIWK